MFLCFLLCVRTLRAIGVKTKGSNFTLSSRGLKSVKVVNSVQLIVIQQRPEAASIQGQFMVHN